MRCECAFGVNDLRKDGAKGSQYQRNEGLWKKVAYRDLQLKI